MVVLTNEALPYGEPKIVKLCFRCKESLWRGEFPHIYARRCLHCVAKVKKGRCKNCGAPAGIDARRNSRRYCSKPECQQARQQASVQASSRKRTQRSQRAVTHLCKPCGKRKPKTEEFFMPLVRDAVTGEVVKFQAWCRECKNTDRRVRYAGILEFREQVAKQGAKRRARERERRALDPEYDRQVRERRSAQARAAYWRKKTTQPVESSLDQANTGKELPAGPLLAAIRVWMEKHAIRSDGDVSAHLGVTERRFWDWRQPEAKTRLGIADRCLVRMELNWFDVWPEAEYPEVAKIWEGSC